MEKEPTVISINIVSHQEIEKLRAGFKKNSKDGQITKEQFKEALKNHIHCWTEGVQYMFLERLFNAFDVDHSKSIDFNEFINGLGIFLKGTPEEKLALSFKIYDVDGSGSIEPAEMIKIMNQLYGALYPTDQTNQIKKLVKQIFDDLDINGDQSLSIDEFKMMAMKEPMMIDIIEQFLYIPAVTKDRRKSLIS